MKSTIGPKTGGKKGKKASSNSAKAVPGQIVNKNYTIVSTGKIIPYKVHQRGSTASAIENYNHGRGTGRVQGHIRNCASELKPESKIELSEFGIYCENLSLIHI